MIQFNVSTTNKNIMQVVNNKFLMLKDNIFAFTLDNDIEELLKGELKDKINGITIFHLSPELGVSNYEQTLGSLIDYIIYYQQNKIINNRFCIINFYNEFHNITGDIINQHQKRISITKEKFPVNTSTDKCYFKMSSLDDYNFTFSTSRFQSYFAEFDVSYEYEKNPIDININPFTDSNYDTNEIYYSLISDYSKYKIRLDEENNPLPVSGKIRTEYTPSKVRLYTDNDAIVDRTNEYKDIVPGTIITNGNYRLQFQEEWIIEKITINLRGMYASVMGSVVNSIVNSNDKIVIERKVRPDEFFLLKP